MLNENSLTDEVDFSEKGKSQFIKQLEEIINQDTTIHLETEIEEESVLIEEEIELPVEESRPLQTQVEPAFETNNNHTQRIST